MPTTDDTAQIMDTLARYAIAMDQRDWALLDSVFTQDFTYDAGEWVTHSLTDYLDRLRPYLEGCGPTQHLLGNYQIQVDGDTARTQVYVRAFHVGTRELSSTTYEMFGVYSDEMRRKDAGWRSVHRTLRLQYELGSREVLRPA